MEHTNTTFETIIARLQNEKPQIQQPELLTENILAALPPQKSKTTPVLKWTRILSSAAAVLLFTVFSVQQVQFNNTNFAQNTTENRISFYKGDFHSNMQKTQLLDLYQNYMQSNTLKNKKLRSYSQL